MSKPDIVASRTLELHHPDRTTTAVQVHVERPRRIDEHEHRCEYEIIGLAKHRRSFAAGVDDLQALALALFIIPIELETSSEGKAGRLTFLGSRDLQLAPRTKS